MPAKPLYSATKIFEVLKNYKVFHDDKKLKKKEFKEPDGSYVWKKALQKLPRMELQNLYLFVFQNRWKIKELLRKNQFSETKKDNPEGVNVEVFPENDETYLSDDEEFNNTKSHTNNISVQEDEFVPMHLMKYNVLFLDIIHRIGIIPFCVTYWSAQQISILKEMLKLDGHSLCVIVLKDFLPTIKLKKYTSTTNCLVSIVSNILNTPTYIANLITETLDEEIVQHFIMDFFKTIPSLPSEITIGHHRGTMDEVCFALNMCSFSEHNEQCLLYLEGKRNALPKVLISVDLIQLLSSASRSAHFRIKLADIQQNLIKLIIYLKYVLNIEEFRTTVTQMLLLICSPYKNQAVVDTTAIIENKINSSFISAYYQDYEKFRADNVINFVPISDVESEKSSYNLLKYIDDLKPNIDQTEGEPNSYYCEFWYTTTLRFLLAEFISWSCILNESRDMNLITNVSRNHVDFTKSSNSTTISKFVEIHILQCDELVLRRQAFLNQKRVKKLKKKEDKIDTITRNLLHLNYQENWGGLNECYKKKELVTENKCDETEIEYKLDVPLSECADKPFEIPDNICTNQNIAENSNFPVDEVEGVDLFSTTMSTENCNAVVSSKYGIEETTRENVEHSETLSNLNVLSKSTSPNEEFHNSKVLAGSIFLTNMTDDLSILSRSVDLTMAIPYKNSTLLSNKTIDNLSSEDILLDHNYSTLSLLNKNIYNNSKNDEYTINNNNVLVDNTFVYKPQVKRQLEDDDSKLNIPIKKKRKTVENNKKKKYVSQCPDMELKHLQAINSKSSRKDSLIRNGNTLEPRSIDLNKYTLGNTSQFDVLVEILSFGYRNCNAFRNYCDSTSHAGCSDTCLLRLITKFSRKGNINSFYADRAALLYHSATVDKTLFKITIDDNLKSFFGRIMSEHPSYHVNIFCNACNNITNHQYFVCNLSDDCNQKKLIHDLLMDYLKKNIPLNKCLKCKKQGSLLSVQLSSYLVLYFEKGKMFNYVDFAETYLTLSEELKFMLIGVITFETENNPAYVAYCRKPSGSWEKRSELDQKIIYCKFLEESNILFLIYIKI